MLKDGLWLPANPFINSSAEGGGGGWNLYESDSNNIVRIIGIIIDIVTDLGVNGP